MFRLWGKEFKDNHMLRDTVICDETDETRTHKIFNALDSICYEAFIGLLGGIAGNILSFVMSAAINIIVGSSGAMSMGTDSTISYIPWWLVLMSMVFAVLVGVLAGYFPAKRAMKLSPLAAIRNE